MSLSSVPFVPGSDTLGHSHAFKHDRLRFLRAAGDTGAISRVRFLRRSVLVASSPQSAHEVLVERAASFEKSPGIRLVLRDLAGDGLFSTPARCPSTPRR
jgi:hypothetical protein